MFDFSGWSQLLGGGLKRLHKRMLCQINDYTLIVLENRKVENIYLLNQNLAYSTSIKYF